MSDSRPLPAERPVQVGGWLNRNVVGMTVTSFLSDVGHEMATSILPAFLVALSVPPAALGVIEGVADASSSFIKLGAGWFSDRLGHRKGFIVGGYALTGASQAIFALAMGWPVVLVGRVVGWLGRGTRGPLRDAMLAESVGQPDRGKAFGFHRAGDTLGAVAGPLLAVGLVSIFHGASPEDPARVFRLVFLLTAVPGLLSAVVFLTVVREQRRVPNRTLKFRAALQLLPRRLRRALVGIGVFGLGDFSHTLIILAAVELLAPRLGTAHAAAVAGMLYVFHNVTYALAPFPVGALSDRFGRRHLLAIGYVLGAAVSLALGISLASGASSVVGLAVIFGLAGIVLGVEDTLEAATVADFVAAEIGGTSQGLLGTVNGIGDLVSSAVVGILWTVHPLWGFGYAALTMGVGALLVRRVH